MTEVETRPEVLHADIASEGKQSEVPQAKEEAKVPESPPNPFQNSNPVVDVTPEPEKASERPEDPNPPKRKSTEEDSLKLSPEPQKRPKMSEDFQEETEAPRSEASEKDVKSPPNAEEQEQRMTACAKALEQVKGLKEEAKRHFAAQEYLKALAKYEDAISAFQKVTVPKEYLLECQEQRAQLLNNIALCCIKIQDYSLALKVTEQGVKEFPNNVKLRYSFASALCHEGEYDRAIAQLKQLNKALPNNEQTLSKIAEIQKMKEEHMAKLKEMYGGKLLPAPVKEKKAGKVKSSLWTWGWILAATGFTIGGFFLARKFLAKKA